MPRGCVALIVLVVVACIFAPPAAPAAPELPVVAARVAVELTDGPKYLRPYRA